MEDDPNMDLGEDTLIYPRIENIYSDVKIKAEPIDIDDDEYDAIELGESTSDYYMSIPNKIILGSKPPTLVLGEPLPGPSMASNGWVDQDNFFECTECNTIYPTQNELDSHKMSCHSFLVVRPMSRAVKTERRISVSSASSRSYVEDVACQEQTRRQKAVKSTAKSSLNKTFPVVKGGGNTPFGDITPIALSMKDVDIDGLVCKHCDVRFPDEIALIKHTYALLPASNFDAKQDSKFDTPFESKFEREAGNGTFDLSPTGNTETMLQCEYCSCLLMLPGFMKKHLLKNHKTTEYAVKRVQFSGMCAICVKPVRGYKQYNIHLLKCHRKIFTSKIPQRFDVSPVKKKCSLCSQIFPSRYAASKHKAEKHPGFSQKHTFRTVYDKPIKQLPATPNSSQALKPKVPRSGYSFGNKTFIPKQVLFKCNKCQIHFVSCSVAFAHSKRCSLAKGDWKCSKCRRSFTKGEIGLHTQQHQVSDKFKVHIVCDKILSKVLCRCPKCELLFDEIAFGEHIAADCVLQNGVECKSCDLKIHSDSFAKHRRLHNKYNFSSGSFILIDFVDQTAPAKEEKKKQFKQKVIYCSTCKCNFYTTRSKKRFHLENKCVSLDKRFCTTCGLSFSRKPFITHVKYDHKEHDLKLDDFKFVSLQDLKVIKPVMPEFFPCKECDIRFLSLYNVNTHSCSQQEFVKCTKCSQKYDPITYDIHMTFHNYGKSNTEVKTSSSILKFYSCVSCNYGFHSYDGLVGHSQKHYINSEEMKTRICKTCQLYYAKDHRAHSECSNFKILTFDSDKLLSDEWLKGFGDLSPEVVEEIKSRSVYGAMRNVRLELLVEGPAERTMYKCAQCELHFEQDYVVDHITDCSNTTRFECSSCSAAFKTRLARTNHMNVHVIYGDDIAFRELIFNKEADKELNDALRTGRQKESLKFRKCQHCQLLIKKSDYQSHVSGHDKDDENFRVEVKTFTFRRTQTRLTYKLFKPLHACKKLYTVYKCRTCYACIMRKQNMVRHNCGAVDKYEKCNKCYQFILSWNLKRHIEQHELVPKFVPKNITVIEFQLLDSNGKRMNKKRRHSSDDDATSKEVNVTAPKAYDTRKVVGRPYRHNLSEDSQDKLDSASVETITTNAYAKRYNKRSIDRKVASDNESEASSKVDVIKTDLTESTLDIDKWRAEVKNKVYQCERCYMCYSHRLTLVAHLSECNESSAETPLSCNQCDMVFHPSLTSFHEKVHDLVRRNPAENYFDLINISTNGRHTTAEKRWLYSCKPCDVTYLCMKSLSRHFNVGHSVSECVRCEICDLPFSKQSRRRHVRTQHDAGLSKEDLHIEITHRKIIGVDEFRLTDFDRTANENNSRIEEITDETMGDSVIDNTESFNGDSISANVEVNESKKIDNTLYKCSICSNHYFYKTTLLRHMEGSSHKMKAIRCDLCGLLFNRRTLLVHKSKQHHELKLTLKDFVIIDSTQVDNEGAVANSVELKENVNAKEDNASAPEKPKNVANAMKNVSSGPIDNHIYKCVVCSIYYINRCTLMLHIVLKKHKQLECSTCDLCGLVFGKGSLAKHKKIQHGKLKLTRKDFIITDVLGLRLPDDDSESSKVASTIDTDELPLALGGKVNTDTVKAMDVKIKLYQCNGCSVCIRRTEIKLHVCCSDIQKKQCIRCCLSFRNTDVSRHQRLHQKYRGLSRKNFVLVRFGRPKSNNIYNCVSCSTHFLSLVALEWHMSVGHKTKREYCKRCGLFFGKYNIGRHTYIHHTKLNLTVEQFNIINVSDKVPRRKGNDSTLSELDATSNLNVVKKLFKCSECDVYFLTRTCYYHHIYRHRKLDSTEFIDCNLCDFQFLNESLGVHMKTHKDKNFCLDNLLIEEYQANSTDSPKIDVYFAKDSLNSKLVSTTTPFDNDDEISSRTDEQLSVIDSTSDELPKDKPVEVNNVEDNSFPPNDSVGEESDLNPVVEPKSDVCVNLSN